MKNLIKKYFSFFLVLFISGLFWNCSSTNPINDFFGIQMNLPEENHFKIISYNEFDGVKYQSTAKMEPAVNAWAEVSVDDIRIKVVNTSPRKIPLNYNLDQFVIITDEKEYILEKGSRIEYFSKASIEPNSEVEFILKLPNDYISDATNRFEFKSGSKLTYDMLRDFSKFGNAVDVNKENIKYIVIKLSDRTLVLKKVPST